MRERIPFDAKQKSGTAPDGSIPIDIYGITGGGGGGDVAPVNGKRAVGADELLINVLDYGAKGDSDGAAGGTDDSAAIALAIAAAVALNRTLWFPRVPFGYRTDAPVVIPGINVQMDSPVYSNHQGIGIDYNPSPNPLAGRRQITLAQIRAIQSNWSSENVIGIRTRNVFESFIRIMDATRNTIGYQRFGDNTGHVHNTIELNRINNNQIGVDCDSTGGGWVNEEHLIGGRFSVTTNTNVGLSRYGIRVRATNNYMQNAQTFTKPSFELRGSDLTAPVEALPILVTHGHYNKFLDVRDEGNSGTVIRTTGNSQENEVTVSFGGSAVNNVDDSGAYPSTIIRRAMIRTRESAVYRVFDTGYLAKRAVAYDASNINIPGMMECRTADGILRKTIAGATVNADHIVIPGTRAVGKLIDVNSVKRFVLKRNALADGGRVVIKPYDAAMAPINGSGLNLIRSTSATSVVWTTDYTGAYRTGGDSTGALYFVVDPSVRFVFVGVAGGTATAKLVSLSLDAVDSGSVVVVDLFPENIDTPIAKQAPLTGTYNRGMKIANAEPGAGLPKGWVCVESGTPGTWISEGNLQ